jgi:heme-degrading monooxygenase HmoA
MILEQAILDVAPERTAAYEAALRQALPLISATPGFLGLEVRACLETPGRYLLLVRWATVEDHTIGFRHSERYQQWRALLHRFYSPMPVVEHFAEPLLTA